MSKTFKRLATGMASLALLFTGLGISNVLAQQEFISVAGEPTGHNSDAFQIRVYDEGFDSGRPYGRFIYEEVLTTPTLDAEAGWVAGDRVAYRCAWAFLTYRQWIVGRVTYTSIGGPNAGGAFVNDAFMLEGQRHYDGTADPEIGTNPGPGGDGRSFGDECTNPPSGDGITEAGPPPNWPDLPTNFDFGASSAVVFYHGPHDIEVRDFADLDDVTMFPHPDLRLRIAAQDERRVTVVGYERGGNSWIPRVEIHFDLMVPGATVPGTAHPVEIRTTLEPHEEPSPEPSPLPSPSPSPDPSPSPESAPSPEPVPLTADFDGDGDVDTDDLRTFVDAWIEEQG